jgi:superfamily II DNA/RNA helicase
VHFVDDLSHKNKLLDHVLRDEALDQAVVFTATKRDADMIADRLNIAGFAAAALHGDMHQGARNRTLNGLRCGQVKVLVATDVAARGIDVPNITHVVNYDLPKFAEDYVHRIGRTGRAGRNGLAISLVNHAESQQVRRIERFTKQTIPVDVVEGLEPKRATVPRSATRPGWKPGDNRYGKKPGQGGFSQGGPRREGDSQRSFGPGAPRRDGDSQRSFGAGAPRQGEGHARPNAGFRSGEGFNRPTEGFRSGEGQPRSNEGYRSGERTARPADNRSGGYKGSHPRSTDSARRNFGDY